MKKQFRTFITLFLLMMGTTMSWAEFQNFSAVLNNQEGTLLTTEEQVQGTALDFGVAVNNGTTVRVAKDDASAVAPCHSEVGLSGFSRAVDRTAHYSHLD